MEQRRPRLEGKVAIVTGAGSSGPGVGTGKATSILFAREGAKVILMDLVAERAEETLGVIRDEGGEGLGVPGRRDQSRGLRSDGGGRDGAVRGGLHILFNNVAILGPGTVLTVEEEDWDRVLSVNLKGMMLTSKYAVPKMIEGGGGSIITVSSGGSIRGNIYDSSVAYAAAKGGGSTLLPYQWRRPTVGTISG